MHLVRAEVCSLRVGRQTGTGCVPQTSQKRRNGKAPCLGGKQETIIQHIEIVKQRGQAEYLTPLFFLCLILYQGNLAKRIYFFSGFPAHRAKSAVPTERSHRAKRFGHTPWRLSQASGESIPFCSMLVKPQDSQRPYHRQPVLAVSDDMAAQSPEG